MFKPVMKLMMYTLLDLIGVQEPDANSRNFYSSHKNWLDDRYCCAISKGVIIYLKPQFKIISSKSNPVVVYLVLLVTNWDINLQISIGITQNVVKMAMPRGIGIGNRIVFIFLRRPRFR